ncbi:leucine-rich repeat protein [Skeletonema marinoi]|uniref:Leucine-rich repeat protein n=1 Tax=Skeletonema marinoi TaxID=267567 RepID=A0AAD8XS06_9STRA|nr:leucine-rich repeat protein [Skeletonema marinoi]
MGKGNDLGWLGYFIGRSVKIQHLDICHFPEGRQQIDAFFDGLARNQSIRSLSSHQLGDYGSTALLRALGNLSQLEELTYSGSNLTRNGWSALGTLFESGACKLKKLWLYNNNIGDDGVAALASGLRSIGPSLNKLGLSDNSIGNEGLSALVAALANCTSLEELDLSCNDFSLAAAGLISLSDWLQSNQMDLKHLDVECCGINDEGLQALCVGAAKHCEDLQLAGNDAITASGLRYLSTSLQSESCRLENLYLGRMNIGDDGAEVLARGLIGNKSLRCLHLRDYEEDIAITRAGWSAFSAVLCDTSSVNNTYLSNHTIQELWYDCYVHDDDEDEDIPENIDEDIVLYLQLNDEHPQYAARCKILMNHTHLDMTPLLQWGLKCLPLAVGWFERSKPCTILSINEGDPNLSRRRQVLDESKEVFQSRILTALYEFVRGVPKKVLERRDELALVAAYDDKIAMVEEEKKRIQEDVESRKRKITQLEEENKRLRGVVESVRNALD